MMSFTLMGLLGLFMYGCTRAVFHHGNSAPVVATPATRHLQ
jgi:hypothetical protein